MSDAPLHDMPATWSDQRMHVLGDDCWCEPTVTRTRTGILVTHHGEDELRRTRGGNPEPTDGGAA